mgnify:CR=1 FL=1
MKKSSEIDHEAHVAQNVAQDDETRNVAQNNVAQYMYYEP